MPARQIASPRASTAGLALVLALFAVVPIVADEIQLVPNSTVKGAIGGRVRGTIQSESPAEVVVKLGNNTINVPTGEIDQIRYDGQPPSLTLAESRESSNQLAEAADLYKKAAAEAAGKPFVEQAAKFRQAQVLAELALSDPGRANEAIGLLEGLLKAFPSSRHTVAAFESLTRLQLQKADYPAAERTIAEMAKLPQSNDRAAVLRARVYDKKGDHARAIAEYDRLIQGAPEGSPRQRDARLAKVESLVGLKKFAEAEADVRAVIKSAPAEDYQAQSAAYNALGDCLRAAGKPKDALLAYLHTDLLYAKDKEQHPRALAQLSRLWRTLKRDDYADEALVRLKQEYPQSPWLAAARSGGASP
jgi:tetratricopeptide (TPR) repeat protein